MNPVNSIDDNGLLYFYQTIKAEMPSKTSDLTNDSNFVADANYVHTDNNFDNTAKTKLDNIESGAQANVQADWNESDPSKDSFIKNKPSATTQEQADWNQSDSTKVDFIKNKPNLGTAAAKDSTNAVTANSTDLVESGAVKTYVDAQVGSIYTPSGDIAVEALLPALLIEANKGNVYNLSNGGETNQYFVEGAGNTLYKGENVQIVYRNNTYMFDRLSGIVDLSPYMKTSDIHWMTNSEIEALIHPVTP